MHDVKCNVATAAGSSIVWSVARKRVDPELLVGSAEIAERLGLARLETVHNWRRRYDDFPEPIVVLASVMLWYWPDVERWADSRRGRS